MAKIEWDKTGEHVFETGVDHGVLYTRSEDGAYENGVAWNGLTSVSESPSGADANPLWADNIKYLNLIAAEEFGATIEAYTYPDEFEACDGSKEIAPGVVIGQQNRETFGFSYRTVVGNDVKGNDYGYKLHLIYGCTAAPSEKGYSTINDSPDAITFSWEVTTVPVPVDGGKPTATVTIDSTKLSTQEKANLEKLEKILYGDTTTEPRMPLPNEVAKIMKGETA